jgi:hypothetical protein
MNERREFRRVQYDVQAVLEYAGETFPSDLIDLSLKGVLISTAASPRKGAAVNVRFTVPQGDKEEVCCPGTVVRADQRGLGIVFDEVGLESFSWIREIVAANSNDPDAVHREFEQWLQNRTAGQDA